MKTLPHASEERSRELLAFLGTHPTQAVRDLAEGMEGRLDVVGPPEKVQARQWWEGVLLLAAELQARPPSEAEALAEVMHSPRPVQAARCYATHKVIFTADAARKAKGRGRKTDRLRSYECEHCMGYHLTSAVGS